ncbi:DAK2 domain-containing protein [Pseudorhizobium marinum]|uniref:DAK2 domain-containing protein n=1 Tax=Pseudorhizobium marinum TaxID=1496690 RepID=UPI000494F6AF|nr:DAK2 domain-containing protein [Pseudorhizobium marinum]MBU1314729.1 dihydroxyacetone kinase subunit L [Alphaproteobacteria bacterium]MBU1551287.1 dihydroxyacetone kinase subunit L [Alphaproteobacteria bacterium]MBU2334778.1 dihydroxyacetone kinase subunit L [Alphaproteobacteria bacterium]MBU2389281.1 dihydroxyacetone kinase subunit L [Alphaproteobacteria bacterium]
MSITVSCIASAIARAHDAMGPLEQVLNDADAKLGDGDTGGMLARVIGRMAEVDLSAAADPGSALSQLAKAATLATGSSLGTLFATGLFAAGREAKGRDAIGVGDLSGLVATARDAMISRGGASLGDKTVLDSLDAVAEALKRAETPEQAARAAATAASDALEAFRSRPNRIGRARMFGDQTIGIDDPGMLAIRELAAALAR